MEGRNQPEDQLLESWLELRDAVDSHPEMKRLLFDPVTGLPTTPLLFPRIEALLEDRGEVSILCMNVVRYSKIEEIYGWKVFDGVMRDIAASLVAITGTYMRDSDIVAELMVAGNAFVIVLSPPRNTLHVEPESLRMLADRVETRVREYLAESIDPAIYRKFGCYTGAATIVASAGKRVERLVYNGLETALSDSHVREQVDGADRKRRLRDIIEAEEVRTLVHPVMDLEDFSVIGYEALSRGPEGGEFERPDKLFKVAYDADLVMELERLCRRKAIEVARDLPAGRLLFINIEPESVSDPELREAVFGALIAESGMEPDRFVLEITERTAIVDFCAFRSTLEYLRALGFSVAVDDAGAGYGSLQCLAEVRPQWLKIDISLIRGIDHDRVRYQLVKSLATFAEEMGVSLIAEGIETAEELAAVKELGVRYGQGFFFCLPLPPFPPDPVVSV
ncbi:MAG TPA: bifunctional diguanylate cyclase/phosphodiesterase [Coriobacteriia bacterium]|jgi:EAL domain-containing protein (putative c-di-GMP-specific phosphodiesterase class I)/GGDEF domain-containing protein